MMRNLLYSLLFISSSLLGAQGTNLIGVSSASQAMGGTGLGNYTNATDALHKNLGFLVEPTAREGRLIVEINSTLFGQNVTSDVGSGAKESQAKSVLIPSLAALYQVDEKLAVGLGVLTTGGAAIDFTLGELNHSQLKNDLAHIKVIPGAAYRFSDEFSLGVSPTLTYGAFALNSATGAAPTAQSTRGPSGALGVGAQLGATVRLVDNLIIGIAYLSKTKLNYKELTDLDEFTATPSPALDDVAIEQPQEIAMGVSYAFTPEFRMMFDYRNIGWGNAEGYQQFGWKNQNVVALGAQYSFTKVAVRAGYNYASSPIENASGENGNATMNLQGHDLFQFAVSRFNLIAYPGLAESHITAGVGVDLTEDLTADLAFVYAPKVTRTRSGLFGASPYSLTTTASQWSAALGVSYQF